MGNEIVTVNDFLPIVQMVTDALTSKHSQRAYGKAIGDFLTWWEGSGKPPFTKATIQNYRQVLTGEGLSPSSVNLRMSAIRKLAAEAADNGLIPQEVSNGIGKIHGVKSQGVRTGNWLTKRQAEELINSPDTGTLKGKRDRAILAVLIGAGLRRSEAAELTFERIQQREGRWVIVDLVGKGNRVRTVPIPSWCKAAIDAWQQAAGIEGGRVFRGMNRGGKLTSDQLTTQAVYRTVIEYAAPLGYAVKAHDLRRTFAKLAHKGGAALDQIQLQLGHASLKTTERYLGISQNLTDAPCDHLGLDLSGD